MLAICNNYLFQPKIYKRITVLQHVSEHLKETHVRKTFQHTNDLRSSCLLKIPNRDPSPRVKSRCYGKGLTRCIKQN